MKRILILLACAVLLASCQADETFDFREEVGIKLKFVPDEASDEAPQSRSDGSIAEIVGEMKSIFDINIYL